MSKPRHRSYVAIEDSMMAAVRAAVETRAKKLLSEVRGHIADGKFADAHKVVEAFTLEPAVAASRTKFKTLAVSAVLFGASRHKPVAETGPAKSGKVTHFVDTALNQLSNMLVHNATLRVKAAAMLLLHDAEDQAKQAVQSIAKADLTPDELAEALSNAIMNNTRRIADVGANLVTSRLASYGFLAEAASDGVAKFQISAINDDVVCPVCEALDGTEFEVDKALSRVEMVLSLDDPEELKVAAPWPDQSQEGLDEIDQATTAELQAMGYDAPPFHPGCRCILVSVADEELASYQPKPAPIAEAADDVATFEEVFHEMTSTEFKKLTPAQQKAAIEAGLVPDTWEVTAK